MRKLLSFVLCIGFVAVGLHARRRSRRDPDRGGLSALGIAGTRRHRRAPRHHARRRPGEPGRRRRRPDDPDRVGGHARLGRGGGGGRSAARRRHRAGARQLRQHDLRAGVGRGGGERHAVLGDRRGRDASPGFGPRRPHVPGPADRRGPGQGGDRVHRRSGGARTSPRPRHAPVRGLVRRRRVRQLRGVGRRGRTARARAARRRELRVRLPHGRHGQARPADRRRQARRPVRIGVPRRRHRAPASAGGPARPAAREHRHVVQLLHAGVRLDVGQGRGRRLRVRQTVGLVDQPFGIARRRAIAAPARERRVSRRSGIRT